MKVSLQEYLKKAFDLMLPSDKIMFFHDIDEDDLKILETVLEFDREANLYEADKELADWPVKTSEEITEIINEALPDWDVFYIKDRPEINDWWVTFYPTHVHDESVVTEITDALSDYFDLVGYVGQGTYLLSDRV